VLIDFDSIFPYKEWCEPFLLFACCCKYSGICIQDYGLMGSSPIGMCMHQHCACDFWWCVCMWRASAIALSFHVAVILVVIVTGVEMMAVAWNFTPRDFCVEYLGLDWKFLGMSIAYLIFCVWNYEAPWFLLYMYKASNISTESAFREFSFWLIWEAPAHAVCTVSVSVHYFLPKI